MNNICGKYKITVGSGKKTTTLPLIISDTPKDLYAACSPEHPWRSSLTFIHGVPMKHDIHGAESTLYGYIRLGTMVAYIPQNGFHKTPPWHARAFIHTCFTENCLIPQPVYAKHPIYRYLLRDAVNAVLYHLGYNTSWCMCGMKYENVYVDQDISYPITRGELDRIHQSWQTPNFIQRL
jgi:hypothetical protein